MPVYPGWHGLSLRQACIHMVLKVMETIMHLLKRMKHWLVRGFPKWLCPQGMQLRVSLVFEFDLPIPASFATYSIIIIIFSLRVYPVLFVFIDANSKFPQSIEICVHMYFSVIVFISALEYLASNYWFLLLFLSMVPSCTLQWPVSYGSLDLKLLKQNINTWKCWIYSLKCMFLPLGVLEIQSL